jgi:putative ABC transport system permease protein
MFGSLVFTLSVTPALIGLGTVLACVLGLIGGLFPALRAARVPVATALRAR